MNIKTVDGTTVMCDPLVSAQKEGVAKMQTSLLSYLNDDISSSRQAISNITILRIRHHLTRIVRFTEMMDRLEDKLYASIDSTLDRCEDDPATLLLLIKVQEKLQKNMIDSQKLLEPYLDLTDYINNTPLSDNSDSEIGNILQSEDRDRLRANAQMVLQMLRPDGDT